MINININVSCYLFYTIYFILFLGRGGPYTRLVSGYPATVAWVMVGGQNEPGASSPATERFSILLLLLFFVNLFYFSI